MLRGGKILTQNARGKNQIKGGGNQPQGNRWGSLPHRALSAARSGEALAHPLEWIDLDAAHE